MGYNPITRAEVRQFADDHGKKFGPWLLRMLLRYDRILLNQASEYHDGKDKTRQQQQQQEEDKPARGIVYVR